MIHYSLLATVFAALYVSASGAPVLLVSSVVLYLCLCLLIAYGISIWVDEPTVAALRRVTALPPNAAFYLVHLTLFLVLAALHASRTGFDPKALPVLAMGYLGTLIVLPFLSSHVRKALGARGTESPRRNIPQIVPRPPE